LKPPRWRTLIAGVFSGALFALAFPPFELPLLAPLALVPWIAALATEEKRRRGLVSGIFFGLTYWCLSIPWIFYVVTRFGSQSGAMGVLSVALLAMFLAQWPAAIAWAVVAVAPPRSRWRFAAFPVLWLAAEHARSNVYGGFPWNLTGAALYRHAIWIQSAAFWGVYGVGFLVVAASTLLAAAGVRRSGRALAAAAVLALVIGGVGAFSLAAPSDQTGSPLFVALLQPNIPQEERLREERRAANYVAVIEQARKAAAERPDLIVVPESAFPVYWENSGVLRRDLTDLVASCRCALLFNDVETGPGGRYYNVARLLTPAGMGQPYRKVHLVPFGEYVPLPRIFFFVRQVSTEIGEFSAAEEPAVLRSGGPWAIGTGVCYEILYPLLSWNRPGTARTCSSRSRTIPGTAPAARRRSTSREPFCGRSRTEGTLCAPPSRGSPGSSTRKAGLSRSSPQTGREPSAAACISFLPGRPGRASASPSPASPTFWRSPCYSSGSFAGCGHAALGSPLTADGSRTMTERDDLLSALNDASDRLAALRGYL